MFICKKLLKIIFTMLSIFVILFGIKYKSLATSGSEAESDEDIYDVILFWGQSNMVGSCGRRGFSGANDPDTRNLEHDMRYYDETQKENYYYVDDYYSEYKKYYDLDGNEITDTSSISGKIQVKQPSTEEGDGGSISLKEFSEKTGIEEEFLKNSPQMNYVKIDQEPGTVYEYKYSTNELIDLDTLDLETNNYYLGEYVYYDSGEFKVSKNDISNKSLGKSFGTNLIPEFSKEYYKQTGHKIVAVFAAIGGQPLIDYLPEEQKETMFPNYYQNSTRTRYIYEAMIEKYNSAIKYLEDNNKNIGNKIAISCHGEQDSPIVNTRLYFKIDENDEVTEYSSSDISAMDEETKIALKVENYEKIYKKVHDDLVEDLDILDSGIISTGHRVIDANLEDTRKGVNAIQLARFNLINNNSDMFLASNYPYSWFDEGITESFAYDDSTTYDNDTNTTNQYNNSIHLTSPSLSQVGKMAAIATANNLNYNVCNWSQLKTAIESSEESNIEVRLSYNEYDSWIANSTITIAEGKNVKLIVTNPITITRESSFKNAFIENSGNLTIETLSDEDYLTLDGNKENVSSTKSIIRSNKGTVNLSNVIIQNNITSSSGGAILINNSTGSLTNCIFDNNKSTANGGGVYITNSTVEIEECTVINNFATNYGGGIYISATGNLNLNNSKIQRNTAQNKSAGGILCYGNLTISGEDTDISYNQCGEHGGAIRIDGKLILNAGNITNNEATLNGGGIHFGNGLIEYLGGTVEGNTANNDGNDFYPDMNHNIDWTQDESLNLKEIKPELINTSEKLEAQPQGMVVTDKYIIYAQVINDTENTIITILDKNTLEKVNEISDYCFGHANDITYNSNTEEVYILTSQNKVAKFKINDECEITDYNEIDTRYLSAIAYDADDNYFIGYSNKNVFIFNDQFEEVSRFAIQTNLVPQGLTYFNKHIALSTHERGTINNNDNTLIYNNKEKNSGLIYMYDMEGNLDYCLYIPNTHINGELECASFYNDEDMYLLYSFSEKDGDITNYIPKLYEIDLTKPSLEVTGNPSNWTNEDVTLEIKVTDVSSGVNKVIVKDIETEEETELTEGNGLTNGEGTYIVNQNKTFEIVAIDNAGNESDTETVEVNKIRRVTSIGVEKMPSETEYYNGETLNTDGLEIKVQYDNNTTETITSGFVCTPTTLTSEGTQEIEVTYQGNKTQFSVTVTKIIDVGNYTLVNNLISNVQPKTNLEQLEENIRINNKLESKILNKSGEEMKEEEIVTTGSKIQMQVNGATIEYIIVVTGDVDGDGDADINDIFAMNKHRLGKAQLENEYFKAGDLDGDGDIDIQDIFKINKYRLGKIQEI